MSLDFKLRYDQLREGDPTKADTAATNEENTFYDGPGHARNLCLIWPDGKRQFLNYAYLVGGTFTPGEDINEIRLDFSAYILKLKGYNLNKIFLDLLEHLPKQLEVTDVRYASKNEFQKWIISDAIFEKIS